MSAIPVTISRLDTLVDGVAESRLVAFYNEVFVGTLGLRHAGLVSACIRQMFVLPTGRRATVGTQLVKEACRIALSSGCQTLGISVASDNLDVMFFYSKLGFLPAYHFDDGSLIAAKTL